MRTDYHTHSTYSDGSFLRSMVGAAEQAGFEGVGISDHCNVCPAPEHVDRKKLMGFNLDETYHRRREAIEYVRRRVGIDVYDAVEMDFEIGAEAAIERFLSTAEFDYAIGSVHFLDGVNAHSTSYFSSKSRAAREADVEAYFEKLVALADSELFEIAAHPDLFERNSALRGLATQAQYDRAARAFARSRTIPELNAGRALREYGEFHPAPGFLEALAEYEVPLTAGTDSHDPAEIAPRREALETRLAELAIEPVELAL